LSNINDKVKKTAKLLGKEFIAAHYAEVAIDDDVYLIDAEGIEIEPSTEEKIIDIGETFKDVLSGLGNETSALDLEGMIKKSDLAVTTATAAAAAVGMIPIPFADLPVLVGAQVTLMSTIAAIFKINIRKDGLKTLVYAAFGIGGAAFLGRAVFSSLIKLIPGIGTIAGGAIAGSVAATITYAMGKAFIEVCKAVKLGELREKDIFSSEGTKMFKTAFNKLFEEKKEQEAINRK
jgi:uncharacterized protein (DUF697 family)